MTSFDEIAQDIKSRKEAQGEFIGNLQSRRLAAIEIVQGFRTVGEAFSNIEGLKETDNHFFTAMGYEVDWEALSYAVYLFLPVQAPEDIRKIIYEWYEED